MRVQEVIVDGNKRYMLLDDGGKPIIEVVKFLKFLERKGRKKKTLQTYCYRLKLLFDYLAEINKDFGEVTFDILSDFMGWLQNPFHKNKVTPITPPKPKRCPSTANLTLAAVTGFYEYLYDNEELSQDLSSKLKKVFDDRGRKKFKDFLYHVNSDKESVRNQLKVKKVKRKLIVYTKDEIVLLFQACNNIRDKFLIKLLFETGMRIGEALSLYFEDIIVDHINGHKIRIKYRGELPNGASPKSGEREINISQELIDLFDDYMFEIIDELDVDTNFLFIKIRGFNKGKPLEYHDICSLMKRLRKKTGLKAKAHLIRHTHGTMYYRLTKNIKLVQDRLGHAQIQTTMNIYLHPTEDEVRTEWEKAESLGVFSLKEKKQPDN